MDRGEVSLTERLKNKTLAFSASFTEGLRYIKATILGQVRKMKAKDEKEASEADLLTAKMQVDAANTAEESKKQLEN
ncbi:hypothetical protein AMTRI_Chr13g90730 [Amborella trichopoda]|uniref:Uncharacterized protein n=1 Tax=Amborella trichopoda TaxID=13333 RepID=U5D1V5_AMBTC|nr:hypothetical protein AMTR_s00033p00208870 [Amborella trichopoda]